MKKYKISEKILFELFSEFSSIMMLSKENEAMKKAVKDHEKKIKDQESQLSINFDKQMTEILGTKSQAKI